VLHTDFRIETASLILRPFVQNDCEAMLRMQSNPGAKNGFRYFLAVVEKGSELVVGYCGLGCLNLTDPLRRCSTALTSPSEERGTQRKRQRLYCSMGLNS
jgi:hypothetical protein